jgi:hypothetical protein
MSAQESYLADLAKSREAYMKESGLSLFFKDWKSYANYVKDSERFRQKRPILAWLSVFADPYPPSNLWLKAPYSARLEETYDFDLPHWQVD